jgi:hypothetical protein
MLGCRFRRVAEIEHITLGDQILDHIARLAQAQKGPN